MTSSVVGIRLRTAGSAVIDTAGGASRGRSSVAAAFPLEHPAAVTAPNRTVDNSAAVPGQKHARAGVITESPRQPAKPSHPEQNCSDSQNTSSKKTDKK